MISKSISYKLVNKSTGLVEAEGSASAMRKLRKHKEKLNRENSLTASSDYLRFEVYLSSNSPMVGQKIGGIS